MILDITIIVIMMVVAICLLLTEIFLLPGLSFAGVGGAVFAFGGLIYAYSIDTLWGNSTLAVSVILFASLFFFLLRSNAWNKLALNTELDSNMTSTKELGIKVGDVGLTLSRLAPIGKAKINGVLVEAKSWGEFIDENVTIVVLRVQGNHVIVKPNKL